MTRAHRSHLTAEETELLQLYARQRGRTWKAQLLEDWMHARLQGPLHALRNSHGPAWLKRFKLPVTA